MYDAIIVGARCAGSPTAMLLARKGYRVLLLDRSTFPSDILSTHYIQPPGIERLKRWGLLARVAASNCPPVGKGKFDVGPIVLEGSPPPANDSAEAYCPRRTVLDNILVKAAVEAGAELREGYAVQEVLSEYGRVTGIRGRDSRGAVSEEQARIVIGADGMHSMVAHSVHAPSYNEVPSLTCGYYSYWSGIPWEGFELYSREGRAIILVPTNDDQVCLAVQWPHSEFEAFRADIEGNFLRTLELAPDLAERVRDGRREARFVGTADMPNFYRRPYGPGWALVGDAGYHKDPHTGQGITDAFRDAELLSDAIDEGFTDREPLNEALAQYERRRNDATMAMYDFTCKLASLEPPAPEMQQLFAALQGNQMETNRFFGAIAGTVPVQEFFAEENIGRIIAEAGLGEPTSIPATSTEMAAARS
ncbi:MAG TPA: NAD(P)/FAD-dependent oxidoreductase [Chloroflexota bacterium]|jgi:flavin-dependent dehydrogenase|nr:NAD(P)/FAD-dependent oxidoreductase [Chloroflexota bacterium]